MSDWYVGAFSRVEAEHALHLVNRVRVTASQGCTEYTTAHQPAIHILHLSYTYAVALV